MTDLNRDPAVSAASPPAPRFSIKRFIQLIAIAAAIAAFFLAGLIASLLARKRSLIGILTAGVGWRGW